MPWTTAKVASTQVMPAGAAAPARPRRSRRSRRSRHCRNSTSAAGRMVSVTTVEQTRPEMTTIPRPQELLFYTHPSVERRVRMALEWKAAHP